MGVYAEAAKRLMGADPVQAQPMPTPQPSMAQQMIARYEAAQQRQQAQLPPETQSQRLHRNLLGDRSPRPTTQAQITQRTDARLQQIQQKPVYAPALMGQPLQSDPTVATEMWNRPDLTPTEQGAAYFGSAVSKGIPFFRHPARRNYGGEVQTDFGDSTLANVAEGGAELGIGLGVNIGEQILGSRVAGMPGMLGAAGLSTASDAALTEQQKRIQRKEAPGTLGEDVSRGVGITRSGPEDTNLARGMRAASVPITMASTMLGVKMSRNVAALAKSAGGVTPEVIRRAALASFGGGATSVAETMVQKAGQGDMDFTNPSYWADPALSFFVGAAADAIGARGDVSEGLTQRAIADLDPNVRPEVAVEGTPQTGQPLTDDSQGLQRIGEETPVNVPVGEQALTKDSQLPIQPFAVNTPEESPLVKGTETQPPVELPKSEQFLKRLGVTTPVQEAAAAKAAGQAATPPEAAEAPQPVAEEPAAATPPPEPPVRAQITPDTNPEDIDTTLTRANIGTIAKRTGTNLLTDSATDTPEKIDELYTQATGEGYHKPVRVMDTANRVMEAHVKGERPSLSPLEVAGLGVRMTQLQLKIKRMDRYIADPEIPEAQKLSAVAELNNLKSEFSTIADARVIASGNSSMALNAIRKAFPELGPTGASLAKQWEMQKKAYTAKGKTVSPEADAAVKKSFKELDESIKRVEAEETSILKKKNELIVKEMAKETRPSTADEKMANIKRILDENNGCDL